MFQGGFDDIFCGYPEKCLSALRRWGVENKADTMKIQKMPKVDDGRYFIYDSYEIAWDF